MPAVERGEEMFDDMVKAAVASRRFDRKNIARRGNDAKLTPCRGLRLRKRSIWLCPSSSRTQGREGLSLAASYQKFGKGLEIPLWPPRNSKANRSAVRMPDARKLFQVRDERKGLRGAFP